MCISACFPVILRNVPRRINGILPENGKPGAGFRTRNGNLASAGNIGSSNVRTAARNCGYREEKERLRSDAGSAAMSLSEKAESCGQILSDIGKDMQGKEDGREDR